MIQTRVVADGRRRYRVRVETATGREVQRTFERLEDARQFERTVKDRVRAGDLMIASRTLRQRTVGEYWADSLAHRPPEATMFARYQNLWAVHVGATWGAVPITRVNAVDVRAWVRGLEAKGLAASSVAQAVSVLSRACGEAVTQGARQENPVRGCRPRRRTQPQGAALTLAQVASVVERSGPEDGPIFLLAAVTGLRFGELAGLQVGDIDPDQEVVRVLRTITEIGGKQEVKPYPKGGAAARRAVGVPCAVVERLRPLIDQKDAQDWLWSNDKGGPMYYRAARRRLTRALTAAGLPVVGLHALRRTAATASLQAGTPLRDVQGMLGHATPVMTLRYAVPDLAAQMAGSARVADTILNSTRP